MPGTCDSDTQVLAIIVVIVYYYYYCHSLHEETETKRDHMVCPRHSWHVAQLKVNPDSLASKTDLNHCTVPSPQVTYGSFLLNNVQCSMFKKTMLL